jgi:hypothetical protein
MVKKYWALALVDEIIRYAIAKKIKTPPIINLTRLPDRGCASTAFSMKYSPLVGRHGNITLIKFYMFRLIQGEITPIVG